jgi:hypothetical protein
MHMVGMPSHLSMLSSGPSSGNANTEQQTCLADTLRASMCAHNTHLSLAQGAALSRVAPRVRVQVQSRDGRRAADGVRRVRVPVQQRVRLGGALEGREDVRRRQRHRQRQQAACHGFRA